MGSLNPIALAILALIALLLLGGFAGIWRRLRGAADSKTGRRFFHGMNPTTSLALAGAMLLALALVVDVYGPDWTPGALSETLSLGLAGSGGVLTLLSFFLDRHSRDRG